MKKIDLHYLTHPTHDRTEHVKRVLRKLGKIPHLVDIHQVQGIEGNIGAGRMEGFSRGNNEYVSFFNDDDDLETSVFETCIRRLEQDPSLDGVVTDECHVINGRFKRPARRGLPNDGELYTLDTARYMHHLVVLRRSTLETYLPQLEHWPDLCEFTLFGKMIIDGKKFEHVDEIGYYWYLHDQNARSMRIHPADETKHILKQMYNRASNGQQA